MIMGLDSGSISSRFSAAADTYDDFADAQKITANRMLEMMRTKPEPSRILDVGCGTGLLTELVAREYPAADIEAIDCSDGQINAAQQRFAGNSRIECKVADALDASSDAPFDMIVSNSSLHWISPMGDLFANLGKLSEPGGHAVIALMLEGTLCELHQARLKVAPGKPVQGRLPRREDVTNALEKNNWTIDSAATDSIEVDYVDCLEFLEVIHNVGVTGGAVSTAKTPLTRSELLSLTELYDTSYANEHGGVYATYEVLYISAQHK